ncbi:MAG: hypothetical protein CW691_00755 [Candidatus Bathyarchaeum sp.]|nr:MAG: hypothetical protein CW691_00755 [Candidatus Bathyarchaeum sp.]
MKREIKRGINAFKNYVLKLMVIQQFLSIMLNMLKRSSLYLRLKLSTVLHGMAQFKTKMANTISHGLHAIKVNATKLSVVLQYTSLFKTKMVTALSRGFHVVSVHATKKRKQTILILFVSLVSVVNLFFLSTISAQLSVRTNLYSYGSIQIQTAGVTAYRDASCNTLMSDVAWGTINPGTFGTNIIYIKNEGAAPITLSLDTINWNPTNAADYMSLTWDYDGHALEPNEVVQITLKLSVSQSINGINNFNFEIIINGTG